MPHGSRRRKRAGDPFADRTRAVARSLVHRSSRCSRSSRPRVPTRRSARRQAPQRRRPRQRRRAARPPPRSRPRLLPRPSRSATSHSVTRSRSSSSSRTASGTRPQRPARSCCFCDSQVDAAKALACAQTLKVQGAQGVINFQVFQAARPRSAPPTATSRRSRSTSSSRRARSPSWAPTTTRPDDCAGAEIGKFAKDEWDCDFTAYVSLESVAAGAANTDRMGGMRDGFKESCPIPADKERILDGADRTDPASRAGDQPARRAAGRPDHRRGHQRGRHPRSASARPIRSAVPATCTTPARAPILPPGRRSPATRTTSRPWPTSRSATARCSSRTW